MAYEINLVTLKLHEQKTDSVKSYVKIKLTWVKLKVNFWKHYLY